MGVLRILFNAEDLGRVRVVSGPEPMWEIVLSLYRLRGHGSAVVFDGWRRLMRGRAPGSVHLLTDLIPRDSGYFPDFLTPVLNGPSLEAGVEELRATPRHRLHADLLTLNAPHPHLPRWTGGLARGERDTVEALSVAVRQYFDACLAASWPRVHVRLDAERARLTRTIGEFGVTHVLRDVHPTARWRPPVLEVAYPVDRELRLAGRGLVLVPSFFCWACRPRSATATCNRSW